MPLIPSRGNMYKWVTHEWRPLIGACPHKCPYCYVTKISQRYGYEQKPLRLKESELKTNLGKGNTIFVCSTSDLFAAEVPREWIIKVLNKCSSNDNTYLFQSKNPKRIFDLKQFLPKNCILGTTIESNRRHLEMGSAPSVSERITWMNKLSKEGFMTTITIEPIMDFDLYELLSMINSCKPKWVSVGADSKKSHLKEPDSETVVRLIEELKKFTEVKIKDNLYRIIAKA